MVVKSAAGTGIVVASKSELVATTTASECSINLGATLTPTLATMWRKRNRGPISFFFRLKGQTKRAGAASASVVGGGSKSNGNNNGNNNVHYSYQK